MKRSKIVDKSTIILLAVAVFLGLTALALIWWNNHLLNSSDEPSKPSETIKNKVDIEKYIKDFKESHDNIEYESTNIKGYISFVIKDDQKYQSIIMDTTTGEQLSFLDLIKSSKLDDFKVKEQELLNLKYPEFIVNGINSSEGIKTFYVMDSEVIVYYHDYTYEFGYNEVINLKIDYNEIKEYLRFEPTLNETYENENGYNYDSNKKSIAITFDDGPSGKYNPLILQELAKNKAHATFFMVGKMMNSCNNCVLQTYKSGNEIGSHTYEHINIKLKNADIVNNSLSKTNAIYNNLTGDNIKLLRPPYGAYSKANLQNINNAFIMWNLDTEDWRYRNVDHIVDYVKENVKDGAIILMHELYETSYQALKIILPWLYANGYQVVSVSELASLKNRTLEVGNVYTSLR